MEHHIERFYHVAWAFYCFAAVKAAVLEDDGFFLFPAATLLEKTLFMQVSACFEHAMSQYKKKSGQPPLYSNRLWGARGLLSLPFLGWVAPAFRQV